MKKNNRRLTWLLLFSALLYNTSFCNADDSKNQSSHTYKPILHVAFNPWQPFRMLEAGSFAGIDIDLLNQLAQEHQIKIQYVQCPWMRCLLMMQTGELDLISGIAWRPERAEYIQYIQPAFYSCATRFYVRKGDANRLQQESDLEKLRIGMVRGSAYYADFDNNTKLDKYAVTQEATLLPLLAAKRIDAYIGTDCQADYELSLSRWHDDFVKAPFKPKDNTLLFLGLSKQSPWLNEAAALGQSLQQVLNNGFVTQVQQHYYRKAVD